MENTVTLLGVVFHEHLLYVAKESGGGISVVQRTLLISIDAGDCSSIHLSTRSKLIKCFDLDVCHRNE